MLHADPLPPSANPPTHPPLEQCVAFTHQADYNNGTVCTLYSTVGYTAPTAALMGSDYYELVSGHVRGGRAAARGGASNPCDDSPLLPTHAKNARPHRPPPPLPHRLPPGPHVQLGSRLRD